MSWLYSDPDIDDYYNEKYAGRIFLRPRRRGPRPGESGFIPMSIFVTCVWLLFGFMLMISALGASAEAQAPNALVGAILLIAGMLYPVWALREDAKVKEEVARRKRFREEAYSAYSPGRGLVEPEVHEHISGMGGYKPKAPLYTEDDDKVWIPGKTHDPVSGSSEEAPGQDDEVIR